MTEPPSPPPPPQPQPADGPLYPHYEGWGAGAPEGGYGGYGGYPAAPPRPSLAHRLGARAWRRPHPRLSIVVAGAGAALLLIGALVWAGPYYGSGLDISFNENGLGSTGGGSRRFLGVVLFLGVTVAGYGAAIARRHGPVATAGAVTAAFGVPLTLAFLTLDAGDLFRGRYPFNVDLVFVLSIAAWLVDYFVVPGLRGRALFLGAAAIGAFAYIALKAAGSGSLARAGTAFVGGPGGGDTGAVTAAGLVFGLAYYGIGAALDRSGRHGAAVALVVAGFYATAGGVLAGAGQMGLAGTGVLLVFLGLGLCWYGAHFGRRFTAWAWGAGLALGVILVVARIFSDSYTAAGITLMLLGAVVVVAAYGLGLATREAPDVEEVPAPAG